MKKLLAIFLCALITFAFATVVSAESAEKVKIKISISNSGDLVVNKTIDVSDEDDDGTVTINDALLAVHELEFTGGVAEGYSSEETDYGISITKLWGDTSGCFGYYLNNASAWSLSDPIKEGDYVYAFVYSDKESWSDTYMYFDRTEISVSAGDEISLELKMSGYDAEWNPVSMPVGSAIITVDGVATEYVTDSEGKVKFSLDRAGEYSISVNHAEYTVVPPICVVSVKAATVDESTDSSDEAVKPGDISNILVFVVIAIVSLFAISIITSKRNENDF